MESRAWALLSEQQRNEIKQEMKTKLGLMKRWLRDSQAFKLTLGTVAFYAEYVDHVEHFSYMKCRYFAGLDVAKEDVDKLLRVQDRLDQDSQHMLGLFVAGTDTIRDLALQDVTLHNKMMGLYDSRTHTHEKLKREWDDMLDLSLPWNRLQEPDPRTEETIREATEASQRALEDELEPYYE